ncbi:putative plastidal glycolate/glycerate translocator 1, chloroplastic [Sesbania bispinosa]|nr:putative plastidal glycolate/glycerate translocator 1, chloroplastic [Sesbania bispinosa]
MKLAHGARLGRHDSDPGWGSERGYGRWPWVRCVGGSHCEQRWRRGWMLEGANSSLTATVVVVTGLVGANFLQAMPDNSDFVIQLFEE